MANFTSKAIKASFLKLLNEKPLNKISVKDIVEDCGINRNSFYYHFQDIPALLEEMIREKAAEIIVKYPEINLLEDFFSAAFEFARSNQRAALHIYQSVSRDVFEAELMKLCQDLVTRYADTAFPDLDINDTDRRVLIQFIKCECFGLLIDWLNGGMQEAALDDLLRITELCKGMSNELIRRAEQKA